ncbi:hypothetical protein GCM10007977_083970 [Dactylosporangium sucinum]|uniref:Uncharacterized protein n=1 Tax=Dactylosporangium sucinum TaxID=1424081 RepID=A0A917U9M4_9ACTN|nr:hypothetical protein GCM10007977_083970 [Dactylosporangium sucinum]
MIESIGASSLCGKRNGYVARERGSDQTRTLEDAIRLFAPVSRLEMRDVKGAATGR